MISIDQDELKTEILSIIQQACLSEGYLFNENSSILIANKLSELILDINAYLEEYDNLFINLIKEITLESTLEEFNNGYYEALLSFANKKENKEVKDALLEVAENALLIKGIKEGDLQIITDLFFNEKSIFESYLNTDEYTAEKFFVTTIKKAVINSLTYVQQAIYKATQDSTTNLRERFQDSINIDKHNSHTKPPRPA